MAYENGIISVKTVDGVTYGVSVYDIQRAVGRGTSHIGMLCSDIEWYLDHIDPVTNEPVYLPRRVGKIIPWAKYKPERSSIRGILTDADRKEKNYGLQFTPSGNDIVDFLFKYPSEWAYLPPRGEKNTAVNPTNVDEWCRPQDFNGYNRNAICFFYERGCTFPSSYTVGRGAGGIDFIVAFNGDHELTSKGALKLSDFDLIGTELNLGQFYCGLLFVHVNQNSQTVYEVITASAQASSEQTSTIHIAESNNVLDNFETGKTYTYYPILSQYQHASLARYRNSLPDVLIALPDPFAPRSFKVKEVTTELYVFFGDTALAWVAERGRLRVSFSAKCGGQSTMGASYRIYKAQNNEDMSGDPITNTETVSLNNETYTTVTTGLINVVDGVPDWVRVHLYYTNNDAVYDDLFISVSQDIPELL